MRAVAEGTPPAGLAGALALALPPWLRRWGISIASLVGGLLALFVFRRELPHVGFIVGYLLLLWLLVLVATRIRGAYLASERRSRRLVATAVDYTIQSLYHAVLLFLLPAYWASTTLDSANAVFFALLVALALLATFDPWYAALVHPRPWLGHAFFLVSTFGALNLALPLVGVPPAGALLLSGWIAVAAMVPPLALARGWPWRWSAAAAVVVGLAAGLLAHAARAAIPPAPLSLARAYLAWDSADLSDPLPVARAIKAHELHERGLVAFTSIYAPAGLTQPVRHVWRHRGDVVDVIDLSPVRGGRREGFRTYSRKTAFPADPRGTWSVDVSTRSGQLIGRLRFLVTW